MTVFYGSVEYFEKEIVNYLTEKQAECEKDERLSHITAQLQDEILHDFVCDETIRKECLKNLIDASHKVTRNILIKENSVQAKAV